MKLLIISGTPKQDGLCHSLVEAAAETAINLGAETETVRLSDYGILSCKMCGDGWGTCFGEHLCKFGEDDGFNALQQKFNEADAFVFVTPVYWGEVSEALKSFFDRLRRCQATKQFDKNNTGRSFLAGKQSIIVASAGGSGGGILGALSEMERALSHMQCGVYDYIGVSRRNQEYKRETVKAAVSSLIKSV